MKKLVILIGLLGVIFISGTAHAYNVYNNTGYTLEIWGEHCPACLAGTVNSGNYLSCPGDDAGCGGTTTITAIVTSTTADGDYFLMQCPTDVPAHGYVIFTALQYSQEFDFYYGNCEVYDANGTQIDTNIPDSLSSCWTQSRFGCPV